MSSRLTRTLLKLYPRRIRNRYGDELLELQDELRAQDHVSRTRLIRDMLAGAFLARPARRAYLVTGAILVIGGLVVAGTIIGGRRTDSPARVSHPRARLVARSINAIPYGSCFVATGSSCSLTPCTEFTDRSSSKRPVAHGGTSAARRQLRVAGARCTAYPHVEPPRTVFVAG